MLSDTRSVSCELLGGVHDLAHLKQRWRGSQQEEISKGKNHHKTRRVQSVHPFACGNANAVFIVQFIVQSAVYCAEDVSEGSESAQHSMLLLKKPTW